MTMGRSHASGTSVADIDLVSLHDYRYLAGALGIFEHLVELCAVRLHIMIRCPVAVGRPGLVGVGSTRLAVDDDLIRHIEPSS